MPYIGQQPTNVAFLTDTFSGNGSTTAFTLSAAPANTSSILVAISGVLQDPSTYSVSGTTLTFSPAPPTGTGNISVRFLGIPASGVTTTAYRTVTEFTATSGQTTFSVPSYTPGFIDVYRNGVMLGSADYTATSGLSVVLVDPCTVGDFVEVISFSVSSVLNAIPATSGSVGTSYLVNGSVTAAKLASGAALSNLGTSQLADANMAPGSVIQVVQGTTSTPVTITGTSYTDSGLSASITPLRASSQILVLVSQQSYIYSTSSNVVLAGTQLLRDSTVILAPYTDSTGPLEQYIEVPGGTQVYFSSRHSINYLDSPSTTSSITYKTQGRLRSSGSGRALSYQSSGTSNGTSTIILMEIAA